MSAKCKLRFRRCDLAEGQTGFCRARICRDRAVVPLLADKAAELIPQGNIGVAYTYNEPLVGYEYVRDCAAIIHDRGITGLELTELRSSGFRHNQLSLSH